VGPATVAPAGFDLIDFDFEDRAGVQEREQAVDYATALRRTAVARSGTSSPAQAQTERSPARSNPDLLDTAAGDTDDVDAREVDANDVDAAEPSAESSDECPAKASADTLFKDIAELMTGNFFDTLPRKTVSTPSSAAEKLGTSAHAQVPDDIVRPWLDTFHIVDDVDEYAQRMMERSYEHREVESDVESEL